MKHIRLTQAMSRPMSPDEYPPDQAVKFPPLRKLVLTFEVNLDGQAEVLDLIRKYRAR